MEANNINTLHNLVEYDISRFLSAEVELKSALQQWMTLANSMQLKTILQRYLDFVNLHIRGIESFIGEEQIGMVGVHNPVMVALISYTDESLSCCTNADIKDACLLACIQRINHYKLSTYGTAAAFASLLELKKDASIFREAEINEKHIDDRLSQLAKYEINIRAKSPIALPNNNFGG